MKTFITLLLLLSFGSVRAADLFIEAESFSNKGGWKVDQQFMDLMGSPYLLAHGMGVPVDDASTEVTFLEKGEYYVYVRTYNWTSPWKKGEGPGKFSLSVGGKKMTSPLGAEGSAWMWQIAGKVSVKNLKTVIKLHDLTGFDGRCDAIYFTTEVGKMPPSDVKELEAFRRQALGLPDEAPVAGEYDLVVVGAGIAGMSAAVSAARLGCRVALINDRPVVGGNNSSEIRVHLGGRIEEGTYKELGGLQKEFGPEKGGNAQPPFPEFSYGVEFNDKNCEKVMMGEWTWETGMNFDQIKDFERIRDYGMLVVYSNWSYLKNRMKENDQYKNRKLGWVAYVAGKRESRRLMGDYILKEDDITKNVSHEDASFATTWSIDLHWQDPKNSEHFPGNEFKAVTKHILIYPYAVPYRCLYSRNVENLFMAGRNISVTHVALGTVRVMRTTGMMGEVVGMAASLCKKYDVTPRGVYRSHLEDLKTLMKEGVNKKGLPNNQRYNEGGMLKDKPVVQ